MKMVKYLPGIVTCIIVVMSNSVSAQEMTVMDILKKMEEIEYLGSDVITKMKFTQQKKDEGVKILEATLFRRDRDDAFLIVMTEPDAEKGNGYLRVGDNMWMYRRNSRTFQKMSRYQSVAGTQMNASDVETRKHTQLYEPLLDENGKELLTEETLGKAKIPVYRLEVKAKVKDLEYPNVIYWVRKDNFLIMKNEAYSQSRTLMMTGYYPKYTKVEDKYIPAKMMFVNEFEKGNKTLLELSGILLEAIDDAVFTKAYLETLSK